MKISFSAVSLALALSPSVAVSLECSNPVELVTNGNFEDGFNGWTKDITDDCTFQLNDGTQSPVGPGEATVPIEGNYDVFTHQMGPGSCALKQTLTIPPNVISAELSWSDRVRNYAGEFIDPDQEALVQVAVDEGSGSVTEIWSTNPSDLAIQIGPNERFFDVTGLVQGLSSVDLWFNERVNIVPFYMNWDLVSLKVCVGGAKVDQVKYYDGQVLLLESLDGASVCDVDGINIEAVLSDSADRVKFELYKEGIKVESHTESNPRWFMCGNSGDTLGRCSIDAGFDYELKISVKVDGEWEDPTSINFDTKCSDSGGRRALRGNA